VASEPWVSLLQLKYSVDGLGKAATYLDLSTDSAVGEPLLPYVPQAGIHDLSHELGLSAKYGCSCGESQGST